MFLLKIIDNLMFKLRALAQAGQHNKGNICCGLLFVIMLVNYLASGLPYTFIFLINTLGLILVFLVLRYLLTVQLLVVPPALFQVYVKYALHPVMFTHGLTFVGYFTGSVGIFMLYLVLFARTAYCSKQGPQDLSSLSKEVSEIPAAGADVFTPNIPLRPSVITSQIMAYRATRRGINEMAQIEVPLSQQPALPNIYLDSNLLQQMRYCNQIVVTRLAKTVDPYAGSAQLLRNYTQQNFSHLTSQEIKLLVSPNFTVYPSAFKRFTYHETQCLDLLVRVAHAKHAPTLSLPAQILRRAAQTDFPDLTNQQLELLAGAVEPYPVARRLFLHEYSFTQLCALNDLSKYSHRRSIAMYHNFNGSLMCSSKRPSFLSLNNLDNILVGQSSLERPLPARLILPTLDTLQKSNKVIYELPFTAISDAILNYLFDCGDDCQTIAEYASVHDVNSGVFTQGAVQAAPMLAVPPMLLDVLPIGTVINSAPPLEQKTPEDN